MATIAEILGSINEGVRTYAQTALDTPTKIGLELAKTVGTITLGVLITVLVSTLREAFAPLFTSTEKTADQVERVANHITTRKESIQIKAEPPKFFDGNPNRVQAFLTEMHMYFRLVGEEDACRTVAFALSRVQGGKDDSATKWADSKWQLIAQYTEKIAGKTPQQITDEGLVNPMSESSKNNLQPTSCCTMKMKWLEIHWMP